MGFTFAEVVKINYHLCEIINNTDDNHIPLAGIVFINEVV